MDVALLIALLLAMSLGVYALRVAADRDRWREEAERARDITVAYGRIASPMQRVEAALEAGHVSRQRRRR